MNESINKLNFMRVVEKTHGLFTSSPHPWGKHTHTHTHTHTCKHARTHPPSHTCMHAHTHTEWGEWAQSGIQLTKKAVEQIHLTKTKLKLMIVYINNAIIICILSIIYLKKNKADNPYLWMDGQRGDRNSCNTAWNRWNKKLILYAWQNIKLTKSCIIKMRERQEERQRYSTSQEETARIKKQTSSKNKYI